MCTASVYKGHTALLAQALATAHASGVLAEVLDDLHDSFPRQLDRAARLLAVSTTKAGRYVGEMREIAATQANAGLTPALFEAMAEVYSRLAGTELAGQSPESIPLEPQLQEVLDHIKPRQSEPGSEATLQGLSAGAGPLPRPGTLAQPTLCGREDLNLQGPEPTGT